MTTFTVEQAYLECQRITHEEARNFSYGIRLLPPEKRRALSAVYATARRIDDIGDGPSPVPDKLAALDEMSNRLRHLDHHEDDPVLLALADAVRRFPIPVTALEEIIEGCRRDQTVQRYATFEELVGYCRLVAGSVGRLSVAIYDPPALEACWSLADTLGVALQLTNILRDVREDRAVGRVYLPREDRERFGCALELDASGRLADPAEELAQLIRFEAARAEDWYARGLRLLPLLDRRSAACTAAMAGIYHRLLGRMTADPELIRDRRLSLSTREKVVVDARALAGAPV